MIELIVLCVGLVSCQFVIGWMKGIADITDHEDNWHDSIFSKHPIDSFYGAKTHTWKRKYKFPFTVEVQDSDDILDVPKKWVVFASVGVSDIWHLSNTIRFLMWAIYATLSYLLHTVNLDFFHSFVPVLFIISIAVLNRPFFTLFYHKILRKKG